MVLLGGPELGPLKSCGWSKHAFDRWVVRIAESGGRRPPSRVGLKYFNVYGRNEYDKGEANYRWRLNCTRKSASGARLDCSARRIRTIRTAAASRLRGRRLCSGGAMGPRCRASRVRPLQRRLWRGAVVPRQGKDRFQRDGGCAERRIRRLARNFKEKILILNSRGPERAPLTMRRDNAIRNQTIKEKLNSRT